MELAALLPVWQSPRINSSVMAYEFGIARMPPQRAAEGCQRVILEWPHINPLTQRVAPMTRPEQSARPAGPPLEDSCPTLRRASLEQVQCDRLPS